MVRASWGGAPRVCLHPHPRHTLGLSGADTFSKQGRKVTNHTATFSKHRGHMEQTARPQSQTGTPHSENSLHDIENRLEHIQQTARPQQDPRHFRLQMWSCICFVACLCGLYDPQTLSTSRMLLEMDMNVAWRQYSRIYSRLKNVLRCKRWSSQQCMLVKSRMLLGSGYECSVAAIVDNFTSAKGRVVETRPESSLPRAALEQMLREIRSAVPIPTASLENIHPLIAIL